MIDLVASYREKTILAVGAHPGDLEIGLGGTIARLARGGARVVMVTLAVPSALEASLREAERGASLLGAARLVVLEPGRTAFVEDLPLHDVVSRLEAVVIEHEPDAILAPARDDAREELRIAHRAVLATLRLRPMDVYLYEPSGREPSVGAWWPRIWVDVEATLEQKLAAIEAHASRGAARALCRETFREEARFRGHPAGLLHAEGLEPLCVRA